MTGHRSGRPEKSALDQTATKDGDGFTGLLQPHMSMPPGTRLVIMPPKADDATAESDAS